MRFAELRLQPAGKRLIGDQRIEIHRRLGHADAIALGRDCRVQKCQRLDVVEPGAFRHEGFDELKDTVGAVDEAAQRLPCIDAAIRLALVEPALGAGSVFGRRQEREG